MYTLPWENQSFANVFKWIQFLFLLIVLIWVKTLISNFIWHPKIYDTSLKINYNAKVIEETYWKEKKISGTFPVYLLLSPVYLKHARQISKHVLLSETILKCLSKCLMHPYLLFSMPGQETLVFGGSWLWQMPQVNSADAVAPV